MREWEMTMQTAVACDSVKPPESLPICRCCWHIVFVFGMHCEECNAICHVTHQGEFTPHTSFDPALPTPPSTSISSQVYHGGLPDLYQAGDINIDFLKYSAHSTTRSYSDNLISNNFSSWNCNADENYLYIWYISWSIVQLVLVCSGLIPKQVIQHLTVASRLFLAVSCCLGHY